MNQKKPTPEVLEIDDRMGLFTIGVEDKWKAYEMMVDWYYAQHQTSLDRLYFEDYWGIGVDKIDPEEIQESTMMRCRGEECGGKWWVGDDSECYDCERRLDHRTKRKTFYLHFN